MDQGGAQPDEQVGERAVRKGRVEVAGAVEPVEPLIVSGACSGVDDQVEVGQRADRGPEDPDQLVDRHFAFRDFNIRPFRGGTRGDGPVSKSRLWSVNS